MRLLLITEVFPPRTGGSGRWFYEIYRRLDPAETTVLAGECEGAEEYDAEHAWRGAGSGERGTGSGEQGTGSGEQGAGSGAVVDSRSRGTESSFNQRPECQTACLDAEHPDVASRRSPLVAHRSGETAESEANGDGSAFPDRRLDLHRTPMSFPTWGVFSRAGWSSYRKLSARVENMIRDRRPEQLHCGKVLPEGLIAWWMKRKRGLPYVCYVHGEELNIAAGSRELRWMTRRVLKSADRVIANSENTAGLLRDAWGVRDDQLRVLHPGVDTEWFRPADRDLEIRQRLGWGDRPVILTVGRLQKRKGHDQLIRSLPALIERHPDLLYSIIGDGPERTAARSLVAELGVVEHVDFRGEVDDDEMLACYQQCDLFALPNRTVDGDFEGFGMVLLEAQACGKPVIAGASGGTGEAMVDGETGFRVDCTSLEAIRNAANAGLCDARQREEQGRQGRQRVVASFSWDSLVDQAMNVFFGKK